MIKISNLSLSFGDKVIFDDLNWIISDSSRIALVGVNGAGKTTLFKSIKGLFDFYHGTIERNRDSKIGYLPQDLVDIENLPLIEYFKLKSGYLELLNNIKGFETSISKLDHESKEYREISRKYDNAYKYFEVNFGYEFENKIKLTLEGLGFKKSEYLKDTSFFSGGWKMRIILAEILLSNPDLMLLDEPTNHLDTESMEYFEDFLRSYKKTFIAISHDRMFLDKMVDQIAELERGKITLFNGTYTEYIADKELKIEEQKKQQKLQLEKIKKTQVFIDKFRYKATKAVQVQSRIKMLEKIDLIELDEQIKHVNILFPDCKRSAYEVIKVEDVAKNYDNTPVLENINLDITRGEKIALVGVNGAGKSTLSRLISLVEKPTIGTVKIGNDVSIGFFAQESSKNLNYQNTIWEEINEIKSKANDQEKRNLLGAFLFSNNDIFKRIEIISGGEKSRLALCKLLLQEYNLLILDEPTNHLDITTKDIFQNALIEYKGTLIIVSHDRYFLDNLVNRVIEIRNHNIFNYNGNYSYFIQKRRENEGFVENISNNNVEKNEVKTNKTREKKHLEALRRDKVYKLRKLIEEAEIEIEKLENLKQNIEGELCVPENYKDPEKIKNIRLELKKISEKLPDLYEVWNKNNEIIESDEL